VAVNYLRKSFPADELAALYSAADVMLVTPLRDGMNLICKEFVATRIEDDGVLVLREFAGAAAELKSALLVNPHDVDALAATIQRALTMPAGEAARRMRALRRVVMGHDVFDWARSFLRELAA
jgi:trehalose 6-phosphate synthase